MKKILKLILTSIIIIISNIGILVNTVQAVENNTIKIYTTGNLSRILKFDGILIKTAHAVYEENGKEYPVYCLDKDLQGVGENLVTYETINQGKIQDIGLWRVIINGYPYKSLEELGVENEEEAYIATKQSIYCYIYNRGTEKYSGIGEAGERTLNAMNKILKNAQNSTEEQKQEIKINKSEKWAKEEKYISKEFEVKSNINISKYTVTLEDEVKDTKIVDLENNSKKEFKSNEKFKILIPIENLKKSGKFKIKINTQMETKPIYYGKAPSENLQDYALTGFSFENIKTEIEEEYIKIEPEKPKEEPKTENPPEEEKKEPEKPVVEVKKLPVTGM